VTTEWVLAEFLAFFSAAGETTRRRVAERTRGIFLDPNIQVLGPHRALFEDGLALYERRPDKGYSLTDCISMHIMHREGLTDVLTNDHHFTQEGFHILLQDG
jgi:predicted nucleic acid-binding protein